MATYNILEEPWIEVAWADGQTTRLGLLETLATAHDLASVVDPSPVFECGIHRLLVAFIMDAFWLERLSDLEALFDAGRFPRGALEAYVDRTGRSHFDLFDSAHPFLQSAPAEGIADPSPDHIVRLVQHLPSGSFATHFFHAREDTHAFSPSVCARALIAVGPFMTAGGSGFSPSVNGMPPWYVLVAGRNLFETLVLNSCPLDLWKEDHPAPPAWRREEPVVPKQERQCTSPLEAFTWQPRRIRLIPGDGGVCTYSGREVPILVREAVFAPGFKSVGGWQDPHVAHQYTDKGGSPLRPREGRPLWQDTGPLLLLRQEDFEGAGRGKIRYQRPYVTQQRQQLASLVELRQPIRVKAYGLRTDRQMKIFEWQKEALSLPAEVFLDPRSPVQVQDAIEAATRIEYHLKRATRMLYPREAEGNAAAFGSLFERVRETYWEELRTAFVNHYLPLLAAQDPNDVAAPEHLRGEWADALRRVARACFDTYSDGLDADGAALRRLVEARRYLAVTSARKLPRETEEATDKEG